MLIKLLFEALFLGVIQSLQNKGQSSGFSSEHKVIRRGIAEISNCPAMSYSPSSISLHLPNNMTGRGPFDGFSIIYRPLHVAKKEQKVVVGVQGTNFTVRGLMENTYYSITVRAYHNKTSKVICLSTIKTKREESLIVNNVKVKVANNSIMIVEWSPLKSPGIFSYQVYLKWTAEKKTHVRLVCENKNARCNFRLDKLIVPHSIFVKAKKINNNPGCINYGKGLMLNLSVKSLSWDSVRASWTKLSAAAGIVFRYQLIYGLTENSIRTQINTTRDEVVIRNLEQLRRYLFRVTAFDQGGDVAVISNEAYMYLSDRNECVESAADCSVNALCINTEGSYFCRCRGGFTGNGKNCTALPRTTTQEAFCLKETTLNITWPTTLRGESSRAPCPQGSEGTASRLCTSGTRKPAQWSTADLSNCVSKRIAKIRRKLEDPDVELAVIADELVSSTSYSDKLVPGDLTKAVDIIHEIAVNKISKVLGNVTEKNIQTKVKLLAKSLVRSSSNILSRNTTKSWVYVPESTKKNAATELIKSVDSLALNVAKIVKSDQPFTIVTPEVVLSAQFFPEDVKKDYTFPSHTDDHPLLSSRVVLPASALTKQAKNSDAGHYVTFVSFERLGSLMSPKEVKNTGNSCDGTVNSAVVSVTLQPLNDNNFESPVVLTMQHSMITPKNSGSSCVFWNITSTPAVWSEEGCRLHATNKTHTICHCYHLTSFAVLMQLNENADAKLPRSNAFALSLITYICTGISVAALVITFLTFTCLRSVRSSRHFIHANLAFSLGLAELLFLFGSERTENKVACRVIAGMMHYLFLVSFAWMMSEGVVLYLMLVKVFESKLSTNTKNALFFVSSWGIPAMIVTVCVFINIEGYGTQRYCWLTTDRGFIWSFVGPVLCTVAFNFFCLVKTCGIIGNRKIFDDSNTKTKKIRLWAKATVLLTCLLGLTWILGVFFLNEQWVVIAYLFNIFNGLQGLMIFFCHCLLDKKVRVEYEKIFCPKTVPHRSLKEDKSSESLLRKFSSQRKSWSVATRMSGTSFKTNFERRSTFDTTAILQPNKTKVTVPNKCGEKIFDSTPTVGRRVKSLNYEEMAPILLRKDDREPASGSQETIKINDRMDEVGTLACSYTCSADSSPSLTEDMIHTKCSPRERSKHESLV